MMSEDLFRSVFLECKSFSRLEAGEVSDDGGEVVNAAAAAPKPKKEERRAFAKTASLLDSPPRERKRNKR